MATTVPDLLEPPRLTGDARVDTNALTNYSWASYRALAAALQHISTLGTLSGQSDGDKGDITVSGETWTVDAEAITYGKIQNVSATDKLLGRAAAGAGPVEEISCTAFARSLLDVANEATFKTTVNLEIGVDVQAYAANLDAWAAIDPALLTGGYTVATLPAGIIGQRVYVTNALAPVFGAAVVGGGVVVIPVFYDGAAWIVG